MISAVGYQILEAAGAVHSAGTPVIIYAIGVDTTDSTTEVFSGSEGGIGGTGVIYSVSSKAGELFVYPGGITFPSGAYVDPAATTTTVVYQKI